MQQVIIEPYKVLTGSNNATSLKFYHEDCIPGMLSSSSSLLEKSVDVIVTSPPYNLGIKYSSYKDDLPKSDYIDWIERVGMAVKHVLKDNGSFFLNMGNKPSDQWIAYDVAIVLRKYFVLQNTIVWVKSITVNNDNNSHGHFKPIPSDRYLNACFEYIFHFTNNGNVKLNKKAIGVPYQDKSNIKRWKDTEGNDLRDRGNTWFIPYETIQSSIKERPHPSTFPVQLPEMCMKLHGVNSNSLVLDPFLGIGSTAIAAKDLGCNFVGFEIDKTHLDEAISRIITI